MSPESLRKDTTNPLRLLVNNDDILLAKSGAIGRVCLVENLQDRATINAAVNILRINTMVHPKFLYYFLSWDKSQRKLLRMSSASAQANLFQRDIRQFPVTIPAQREQQKIASILSKVDELIQKTEQIIEQTQRLKKGLMQKLLTKGIGLTKFKKTELGQIPEEWRTVKLKEVVSSYKNGTYKKSSFYGRGVLNIRMFNIQDGKINTRETPFLDVSAQELLDYGLKPDDILINRVNSAELVGKAGILNNDIGSAVFDSMIIRVRVNELCIPHFLNYYLNSKIYFRQIEGKIKHAIGQSSLNQDDLNNLLIGLPTQREQRKIVSILSILDDKTENLVTTNQKNKNLKKALMQQLLTGKIRVKV